MTEAIVRVRGLSRRFGARFALRDLDLDVGAGHIVGIAGPNGAGKSTLLQILAGLLRPSAGQATVFGLDPWHERATIMRRARFAFAPPGLFGTLTAREHLAALAAIGRVRPAPAGDATIDATLDLVGLAARGDEPVATFSFGMRQRLALAIALSPRPELLVLDEPGEGLDPLAVLELRAILQRLRTMHGVSVLLSSHLLLELDALVDHLVVLEQGEVLCAGAPQVLRGTARRRLRVSDPERAARALAAANITCERAATDDLWLPPEAQLSLVEAQALLAPAAITVLEFAVERPSLEAALLSRLRRRAAVA